MVAYDPEGATEEFFDAVWQQISRGWKNVAAGREEV